MRFLLVEFALLAPCIAAVMPIPLAAPGSGRVTAARDERSRP